jgi:hypothetical protein
VFRKVPCGTILATVATIARVAGVSKPADTAWPASLMAPTRVRAHVMGSYWQPRLSYNFCSMRRKILCGATTRRGTACQSKAIERLNSRAVQRQQSSCSWESAGIKPARRRPMAMALMRSVALAHLQYCLLRFWKPRQAKKPGFL